MGVVSDVDRKSLPFIKWSCIRSGRGISFRNIIRIGGRRHSGPKCLVSGFDKLIVGFFGSLSVFWGLMNYCEATVNKCKRAILKKNQRVHNVQIFIQENNGFLFKFL